MSNELSLYRLNVDVDRLTDRANHIGTQTATTIIEDPTHRFITDDERNYWNNKANNSVVTTSANGLMLAADKIKLNGIALSANNYVHPDTHPATMIVQDTTHRFITDEERTAWSAGNMVIPVVTESNNGLMLSTDKIKLDGIALNANNYSHPSSHPATMITADATHRFVTDSEKITWNAKANASLATTTTDGLMSAADKLKLDSIEGSDAYLASMVSIIDDGNLITATNVEGALAELANNINTKQSSLGYTPVNKAGDTMNGILAAQSNTAYSTKQVRNIILSTSSAVLSSMADGDIWIKYV